MTPCRPASTGMSSRSGDSSGIPQQHFVLTLSPDRSRLDGFGDGFFLRPHEPEYAASG